MNIEGEYESDSWYIHSRQRGSHDIAVSKGKLRAISVLRMFLLLLCSISFICFHLVPSHIIPCHIISFAQAFVHRLQSMFLHIPFMHPRVHSFVRSFVASIVRRFIRSLLHAFIHPSIRSFIHTSVHSSIHSLILPFVHAFVRSCVRSLTYSCAHSFVRSFVHSFILSCVQCNGSSFGLKRSNAMALSASCWKSATVRMASRSLPNTDSLVMARCSSGSTRWAARMVPRKSASRARTHSHAH